MQHVPSFLLQPRPQVRGPSFRALHAEQIRLMPQNTSVEVRWASRGVTMLTTFAQIHHGRFRRHNPRLGQMYSMLGGRTPLKFVFSQNTSRHHLDKDPSERSHSHVGSVFQMLSVRTFVTRMQTPTPRRLRVTACARRRQPTQAAQVGRTIGEQHTDEQSAAHAP